MNAGYFSSIFFWDFWTVKLETIIFLWVSYLAIFVIFFLQVTYRVVQVTDQPLEGRDDGGGAVSVVSAAAFSGAPQALAQVNSKSL